MKYIKFVFLLLSSLSMISCSSDKDDDILKDDTLKVENEVEDARYYVKYESYIPFLRSATNTQSIVCVTDKGEERFTTVKGEWEGIFGPVKKGTVLYINVVATGLINGKTDDYVRLSVCREKEPFVVKAEDRKIGAKTLRAEYVIDF